MAKNKKSSYANKKKPTPGSKFKFSIKHMILIGILVGVLGVAFVLKSSAYRTIGIGVGTFNAYCDFSHRSSDDPIVFPGLPGAAHSHDFFGARTLNAFSTNQSIREGATSCVRPTAPPGSRDSDRSAYWVPTLYVNNQPVQATRLTAQNKSDFRVLSKIEPFPEGLRVIAGTGTGAPSIVDGERIWFFNCNATPTVVPGNDSTAPTCKDYTQKDASLNLTIRFPDCWDGVNLDSPDHKSHMAYSKRVSNSPVIDECPASHPRSVPSLQVIISYPTNGGPTTRLSSGDGGIDTAHADFMNGWVQSKLASLVTNCLRIDNYCGGQDTPVIGHPGNEVDPVPGPANTGSSTNPAKSPGPSTDLSGYAPTDPASVQSGGGASAASESGDLSSGGDAEKSSPAAVFSKIVAENLPPSAQKIVEQIQGRSLGTYLAIVAGVSVPIGIAVWNHRTGAVRKILDQIING